MPHKVLIVEDNPLVAKVWGVRLARAGYDVRTAGTGGIARITVDEWKPDVILLDVVLPDADGLSLCAEWKSDPRTRQTKVIFVSAFGTQKDIAAAVAAGADGYVPKSSETAAVLAANIERCLGQGTCAVGRLPGGVPSGA